MRLDALKVRMVVAILAIVAIGLLGYEEARAAGCGEPVRDESFFWGFYAPIASRLLASRAR